MNEVEISRIAAAISDLRPDWPAAPIRSLLNRPELKNRPRRDVAVALTWVACEADTKTPARVIEAGPWWRAAALETSAGTVTHTGKTIGLRHGDPRTICGICDMWRNECEARAEVGGHEFVARIDCLPARIPGVLEQGSQCLAGPVTRPCQLAYGHEGPHDCPPDPTTAAEVARLRALLTSDAHQPSTEQGADHG
jgi:hypothetical protein